MKKSLFEEGFEQFMKDCPPEANPKIMRKIFENSFRGAAMRLVDSIYDSFRILFNIKK